MMELETNEPNVDAVATGVEVEVGDLLGFEDTASTILTEPPLETSTTLTEPPLENTVPVETVPVETPYVEPVVVEPTSDDKFQQLMEQNKNLLKLVGELSNRVGNPSRSPQSIAPVEEISLESLLENVDFDEIMESKVKFTEFFKKAMASVRQDTFKELSGVIPQVVTPHIQQQVSLQEMHRAFYENNPELSGLKGYVTQLAQELSSNNPDWAIGKVLDETAKTAKANLGLNVIHNKPPSNGSKPALAGGTTGTRIKQQPVSDMQSEIDDILN